MKFHLDARLTDYMREHRKENILISPHVCST